MDKYRSPLACFDANSNDCKNANLLTHLKHAEGESTENIRVFGAFLRARGVFWEKNDGDRGVFPVFGKTLFCVETVRVGGF